MKVVWKKSLEEANAQDTLVTVSPSPDSARSESVLALNPLNDLNMVGASKRFTDPAKYGFTLAAYATFDGGTTWTEAALALPASWGGITDSAVGWDDAGNVYLAPEPHPSRAGRQASTRKRVLRACVCLTGGKEPPPVLRPFQASALSRDPAASHNSRVSWSSQQGQSVQHQTPIPGCPSALES